MGTSCCRGDEVLNPDWAKSGESILLTAPEGNSGKATTAV